MLSHEFTLSIVCRLKAVISGMQGWNLKGHAAIFGLFSILFFTLAVNNSRSQRDGEEVPALFTGILMFIPHSLSRAVFRAVEPQTVEFFSLQ